MDIDWQRLRKPLIVIILVLSVSIGLVWHSYYLLNQTQADKIKAETALKNVENLQEESQIALEILQQSYPNFQRLKQQGVMADEQEQRLYWLNRLHQLKEQFKLKQLSYRFSQQKTYVLPQLLWDQRFHLYVTDMDLDFNLQHSQDLLNFVQTLAQEKPALLKLQSCILQRKHTLQQALQQHDSANLQAHCRLQWFMVDID